MLRSTLLHNKTKLRKESIVYNVFFLFRTCINYKCSLQLQDARSDSEDDEKDEDDDDVLNDENFKEMSNNNTGNDGIGQ